MAEEMTDEMAAHLRVQRLQAWQPPVEMLAPAHAAGQSFSEVGCIGAAVQGRRFEGSDAELERLLLGEFEFLPHLAPQAERIARQIEAAGLTSDPDAEAEAGAESGNYFGDGSGRAEAKQLQHSSSADAEKGDVSMELAISSLHAGWARMQTEFKYLLERCSPLPLRLEHFHKAAASLSASKVNTNRGQELLAQAREALNEARCGLIKSSITPKAPGNLILPADVQQALDKALKLMELASIGEELRAAPPVQSVIQAELASPVQAELGPVQETSPLEAAPQQGEAELGPVQETNPLEAAPQQGEAELGPVQAELAPVQETKPLDAAPQQGEALSCSVLDSGAAVGSASAVDVSAKREDETPKEEELKPELTPGAEVQVHGLKVAGSLNGRKGRLLAFHEPSGRWQVRLHNGASKAMKPENLKAVQEVVHFAQMD